MARSGEQQPFAGCVHHITVWPHGFVRSMPLKESGEGALAFSKSLMSGNGELNGILLSTVHSRMQDPRPAMIYVTALCPTTTALNQPVPDCEAFALIMTAGPYL